MNVRNFLCIFILILIFNLSYANPILELYFNEIKFDSTGWKIEFQNLNWRLQSLDSCYLTSSTDTVCFKPGIAANDSFLVITADSMLTNFNINDSSDIICFYENPVFWIDEISFGPVLAGNMISAPNPSQSICLYDSYSPGYGQTAFHYLDNTPTLGLENDFTNAEGWVEGIITDTLGQPIQGVEIEYDWNSFDGPIYVNSDSNGYFNFYEHARKAYLHIRKLNFQTEFRIIQIWPEDTVTINVTLLSIIDAIDKNPVKPINTFELSQNFPNPFNNSTSFTYTLPKSDFVEITVFDLTGKLIEKLFSEDQPSGKYKVHWNARSVASGVYIYQFKTNEFITHKKCLLIK